MTRAAQFTQGDISRLSKGLKAAGFKSVRIEIKPTGELLAIGSNASEKTEPAESDWDHQLDAEKEKSA